ncbi:MAG: hypothetical protein H3C35_13385 [Bacteroidetes bacterium]|nr:hypothetical protein [Bacteroidota bacterium]
MKNLTTAKHYNRSQKIFVELQFPIDSTECQIKIDGKTYDFRDSHFSLSQAEKSKNESRLKDEIVIVKRREDDFATYLLA